MQRTTARTTALRALLMGRQSTLQADVTGRVRSSRVAQDREVGDMLDTSDADVQHGMEFTLLQMKTEMLASIGHALRRLEAGTYGVCVECEEDIAERRLAAVPFATRCQACEGRHEGAIQRGLPQATARFEPETTHHRFAGGA